MSDNSEDKGQNDKEENICRDFIRGNCDRKFCKFKHEPDIKMLNFCHDFQNNICPRPSCKSVLTRSLLWYKPGSNSCDVTNVEFLLKTYQNE